MGTGKTEISKELKKLLGWDFIDVDAEIEKTQNMKVSEIFKNFGEPKFREMEKDKIEDISKKKNSIISTGGGAVLKEENVSALRRNGVIVCLTANPETILKRTANNSDRPLLQVDNPLEKIKELLKIRKPYYEKADITIDTEGKTPGAAAKEIVERIKNWNR